MKMQRIVWMAALTAAGVGLSGCATNSMVADDGTRSGIMFGSFGVVGHNNNVTALRGSKLKHISIIGDGNTITIEDGVTLRKIEFWGRNNVVSVPANLVLRQSNVGDGNQIIPRSEDWAATPEFRSADDVRAETPATNDDPDE